jgi:soluble lytic murein transglycosylase-like protein
MARTLLRGGVRAPAASMVVLGTLLAGSVASAGDVAKAPVRMAAVTPSTWFTGGAPALHAAPPSPWVNGVPPLRPASHWFSITMARGWPRRSWRPRIKPSTYDALIREIAEQYRLEYALVKAMIQAESDFDHRAVSPKGACGLMQLMPATARSQGVRDVFLPRENIEGGCRYLRMLLDRYAGNVTLAVAAYNAGPERVDVVRGVPAIAETREYVSRVLDYRVAYLATP